MANDVVIHVKGKDDASRVLKGVKKEAGGLGASLKNVTQIAGGFMLAQGIMKAPQIIGGLMSSASDLELQMKKANVVFGDQISVVKKWADENAHSMGLTKRSAINAAAGFADLLVPMGFTREMATGMATDVVGLSGALAEWSGGKYKAAEVSEILAKAMLGEREGLKALGISITEAEVKGKLLQKGQEALTGAALQQAKAVATQELVFEKSTDAQTAYAEGAGSAARKQAALKAKLGEVKEEIALKLAPAFTKLLDIIVTRGLPAFEKLKTLIGTHVVPVLKKLVAKFQADVMPVVKQVATVVRNDLMPALQKLARDVIQRYLIPALDTLADLWKNLQPPLNAVWGLIQSKVLPVFKKIGQYLVDHKPLLVAIAAAILLLVAPWALVVAAIIIVLAKWDEISKMFMETIPNAIDSFLDKIGEIPIIGEIFKGAFEAAKVIVMTVFGIIKNYIETTINAIKDIIKIVTSLIKGDWEGAWQGVKDLVTGIWDGIKEHIKLVLEGIKDLLGVYAETFLGAIKDGWTLVKDFFLTTIPDFFKNNWKQILLTIFGGIPLLLLYLFRDKVKAAVTNISQALLDQGAAIVGWIADGVRALPQTLANFVVDAVKAIGLAWWAYHATILGYGKKVVEVLWEGIQSLKGWLISKVTGLVGDIVSMLDPRNIAGKIGGGISGAVGSISPFAEGGIVTKPTLALIGERGPEAVIPLEGIGPGVGAGKTEIHMHVQGSILSEHDVVKIINDALQQGRFRGTTLAAR